MTPYASRTGTKRNLAALREAGWRLLVSARGVLRHEGFTYALDNGAWTAHQKGEPFDSLAFRVAVDRLGVGADWVVVPDRVGDKEATLQMMAEWMPWCLQRCKKVLVAVQDGMVIDDIRHLLGSRVGVAIGGSTEWKEQQLAVRAWSGPWHLHALRVNTCRRIRLCAHSGCDSFDGSSASRFASNVPMLTACVKAANTQMRMEM